MSYIGNTPAESFISFEKQVFTIVNSQTAYTLSHSVVNENDIRLVVNNVVQEPGSGKAYTASGTTLTLSAALVNGTDTMYCVFLGRALQTVNPPNSSVGSSQVEASIITGQTALAVAPDSTDELLISDAGTLKRIDASLIGGQNTPAFKATGTQQDNISTNTATKLQFDTEVFDTDNAFDTSTYRFTPQTAGKYYIKANISIFDDSDTDVIFQITGNIYKNGSSVEQTLLRLSGDSGTFFNVNQFFNVISLQEANGSSDYFEVYAKFQGSSSVVDFTGISFEAYKIIGA